MSEGYAQTTIDSLKENLEEAKRRNMKLQGRVELTEMLLASASREIEFLKKAFKDSL